MGIISTFMLKFHRSYLYLFVLNKFYFHTLYLSRPKSLDKYKAWFDHKISNLDQPFQKAKFMKCCRKLTGLSWYMIVMFVSTSTSG